MFEERARPRRKMPTRTLLLMILALAAFARMWWVMVERPKRDAAQSHSQIIDVVPLAPSPSDGG